MTKKVKVTTEVRQIKMKVQQRVNLKSPARFRPRPHAHQRQ